MARFQRYSSAIVAISLFVLLSNIRVYGQGGKEFLQWLKEYSPTGYFVINDYETNANKPGFHKAYIMDKNAPIPVVPVHEVCHMWNWQYGGATGKAYGYFIGNNKGCKVTPDFKAFNSKLIAGDIPAELRTTITDIYIIKGVNGQETGSMVNGLFGIMDEYSTYVTGLKAGVEMGACLKANFNKAEHWNSLANEASSAVEGSPEFRYFILRYILYAKKAYKDIYDKIIASREIREVYTILKQFHEQTMKEYIALLTSQNMDTQSGNGFSWYKKFNAELEKQEYKDLENLLLTTITAVDKSPDIAKAQKSLTIVYNSTISVALYNMQGKTIFSGMLNAKDASAYRILWHEVYQRFGTECYIIRLNAGKDVITQKMGVFPSLSHPVH